jgi:hypothetical protein
MLSQEQHQFAGKIESVLKPSGLGGPKPKSRLRISDRVDIRISPSCWPHVSALNIRVNGRVPYLNNVMHLKDM